MQMNRPPLTDPVQPPDPLFQQYRILRQIPEHQVPGELKIPALTADFRAQQNPCPIRFRKPSRLTVAQQQCQALVENPSLDIDLHQKCFLYSLCPCPLPANQQHFFIAGGSQQPGQPPHPRRLLFIRQGAGMPFPDGKSAKRGPHIPEHHPTNPTAVQQVRYHYLFAGIIPGLQRCDLFRQGPVAPRFLKKSLSAPIPRGIQQPEPCKMPVLTGLLRRAA